MIDAEIEASFVSWQQTARRLFSADCHPDSINWIEAGSQQGSLLFAQEAPLAIEQAPSQLAQQLAADLPNKRTARVPREFVADAKLAAVHRDPRRWQILYRLLWRFNHGEPNLLEISVDEDVALFNRWVKAVGRDLHKMHAFVRFRKIAATDGDETFYIAWHCPDHAIIKLAAPFFAKRFKSMRWSILTPDGSAAWDGETLQFGPGVTRAMAPKAEDDLEELWLSYYASIFNPARIKTKAMKREMPVRHWSTLPETKLISDLLANSSERVAAMVASQPRSAAAYLPQHADSLTDLHTAIMQCAGCDLSSSPCQPQMGSGHHQAKIVVVADQPGDEANINAPALSSAAKALLDEALAIADLDPQSIYLTYAVKHSKYRQLDPKRGIERIQARDVAACRPWLGAELKLVNPEIIICLGSAAALAVLGRMVRLQEERGQWLMSGWRAHTLVTEHPASILAITDPTQQESARVRFFADVKLLANSRVT